MSPLSPEVVSAQQAALRHERMMFSSLHDLEHMCESRRSGKLQKYYDGLVEASRARRRHLLDRLYMTEQIPEPDAAPAEKAVLDEEGSLTMAQEMLAIGLERYRDLYAVSVAALDVGSIKIATCAVCELEETLHTLEQMLDKVARMGSGTWYAEVAD